MKAKGRFISFLLVVDTFFAAYAYGFHCRHVLVVDSKMAPLAKSAPSAKVAVPPVKVPSKGQSKIKSTAAKVKKENTAPKAVVKTTATKVSGR